MRKQVLFIAIFAILLSGCNAQQAADDSNTMENENVTPVVEDTLNVSDTNTNEAVDQDLINRRKEEDDLNNKTQKDLDEFYNNLEGPLKMEDCEKLTNPALKDGCIESVNLSN